MEESLRQHSSVTHELKNPLLAIERLASMVLERETVSEDARRKLELIRDSAEEASSYLEEIDVSPAASGPEEIAAEPVDVGDLARRVVESFQVHAEYKGQDLRCTVAGEECVVVGDAVRLREAMNNLVSNALKYSPRGERIDVRVEQADGAVRFSVSDNGPGLEEDEQEQLFEPFRQAGPEPTAGEGSSGLGLYVVKQVAERHGGTVELETAKGSGSTFVLELPVGGTLSGEGGESPGALPGEKSGSAEEEPGQSAGQGGGRSLKVSVSMQLSQSPSGEADAA
ncbi:MAG: sensor histidine kinase [Salinibacter sp.]|uniref:sensor histidine kinase n=1 Tax=Salinibacter sp. TaxID=2065818 RepID=UPI0035D4B5BB